MQLGDCLFDAQKGLLTHQGTQEQWQLPRAEWQVLRILAEHQDQVVPKQILGAADAEHPPLSDSSVTRAIFMLRSFLGPVDEHLIETVKGKGYRLKLASSLAQQQEVKAWIHHPRERLQRLDIRALANMIVALIVALAVTLCMVFVVGQWLSEANLETQTTAPFAQQTVALESGQQVTLSSFATSKTNNTSLIALTERLAAEIKQCESSPWRKVFLSLSHDKQVFNITLSGEKLGQSVVRNLKLTDFRQRKAFLSEAWLAEVSLCE